MGNAVTSTLSRASPGTHHLPSSVLKASAHDLCLLSFQPYEVGADDPISQSRKLSLREVKSLAQGQRQ